MDMFSEFRVLSFVEIHAVKLDHGSTSKPLSLRQWNMNMIDGTGTPACIYIGVDGREYRGRWMDSQMHGCGRYQWANIPSQRRQHRYMSCFSAMALRFLTSPVLAGAWFDTGHMLVAQIAKSQLPRAHVETVDHILSTWSADFPGMSDFIRGAVWADHIKCTNSEAPVCGGLPATALGACLGTQNPRSQVVW
eukprot:Skav222517  [mRNA]  locus=scaffold2265:334245:336323:- [translate_table: standard]